MTTRKLKAFRRAEANLTFSISFPNNSGPPHWRFQHTTTVNYVFSKRDLSTTAERLPHLTGKRIARVAQKDVAMRPEFWDEHIKRKMSHLLWESSQLFCGHWKVGVQRGVNAVAQRVEIRERLFERLESICVKLRETAFETGALHSHTTVTRNA